MIMHANPNVAHTAARIGVAIRDARKNAGLNQQELALVAGVSTRTVYAIEHEKPTMRLDGLVAVLSALGLELAVTPAIPGRA
jgi:y4mF family transcriptional regulator